MNTGALKRLDRVAEMAVLETRILDDDDRVFGRLIAGLEEREHRVRRILFETVVSFGPEVDDVGGRHVSDDQVERSRWWVTTPAARGWSGLRRLAARPT